MEVKTRRARGTTPAEAAVDGNKRRILRKLARAYTRQLPPAEPTQVRFDVMSVYLAPGAKPEIVLFENAARVRPQPRDHESAQPAAS